MPLFSVVIPVFNRAAVLKTALDSVVCQNCEDFEVLVVDDGSDDSSAAVARQYGDKVRVLEQVNQGPGAARNLGIQHARGRYVAFLDSDDCWFPWTLQVYAQVIRRTNGPAFIAGKPKTFSESDELKSVNSEQLVANEFVDYYASGDEWRWYGASSFVARLDALRAVGGFTSSWVNCEDADLAMRLGTALGFVQIKAPVTFAYREHVGSAKSSLVRTVGGVLLMLSAEQGSRYPGGDARAAERRRILGRHVRPVTLDCLRQGLRREAWDLYRRTLSWHLRQRRWKYLLGFYLKATVARS